MISDLAFKKDSFNKEEFMSYLNLFSSSVINDLKLKVKNNGHHDSNHELQTKRETYCEKCVRSGDLLMCDHCQNTFHLHCLGLTNVPVGQWVCPKCMSSSKTTSSQDWPTNLALLHSYVILKTAKEEEKKGLERELDEGIEERKVLEERTHVLKQALMEKMNEKCELLEACNGVKKILGVMTAFLQLLQSSPAF